MNGGYLKEYSLGKDKYRRGLIANIVDQSVGDTFYSLLCMEKVTSLLHQKEKKYSKKEERNQEVVGVNLRNLFSFFP